MKSKAIGEGVIKGTLFLTLSTLVVKFLGVIYKIPLSNYLGDEGMGYFNSAYTVFSFFYIICTAGVPKAVMLLTGEARIGKSRKEEERIMKYSLLAFFVLGSFVTLLLIFTAPYLSALIGSRKATATIITVSPSILFVSLSGVLRGRLTADMHFFSIAVSQILEAVGRLSFGLVFAVIGIKKELPVESISALTILGVSLGAFFSLLYLYISYRSSKKEDNVKQKYQLEFIGSNKILSRLFKISIPITLSAAVMSLSGIVDLGLVMRRLTEIGYSESEAAGLYGNYTTLAVSMFNLAIALITPISVAFLPVFSRFNGEGKSELLDKSVKDSLKFSSIIGAPIMFGLMFYSEEILSLLFENSSVNIGAELLKLLSPAVFFMWNLLIVNSLLEASGEVRAPMYSMLFGCIFKVVICYFLVSNDNFGIYAAPIGTVISYAVALLISLILASKKKSFKIPVISAALPSVLMSLFAVIISFPAYNFLKLYLNKKLSTLLIIVFVAIIYIFLLLISGVLNRKELNKMAKYTKNA